MTTNPTTSDTSSGTSSTTTSATIGTVTDATAGAGLSWRHIADVDAARWDYRVSEARAAAVEADPAATEEEAWEASLIADLAQDWLGALVRDRSQAAGATLGDWPAVVVSDVDPFQLPDDLLDGHTSPARTWYEQVRGITLDHDTGPALASVPAPADGRDHAERWDTDDTAVLGHDAGDGDQDGDSGAGWNASGLWGRLVSSHYQQAAQDYGNLHSSHAPEQDERMPDQALTARQDWTRQLAEQTGVPEFEIKHLAREAAYNHGYAHDADYRDYLTEPDGDAVLDGTYTAPDPWAGIDTDYDDDHDSDGLDDGT